MYNAQNPSESDRQNTLARWLWRKGSEGVQFEGIDISEDILGLSAELNNILQGNTGNLPESLTDAGEIAIYTDNIFGDKSGSFLDGLKGLMEDW